MNFFLGLCPEAHHACEAGKLDQQTSGRAGPAFDLAQSAMKYMLP